jgi:hypothetical protein
MSASPQFPLATIWEAPHGGELIRFSVCEFKGSRYAELRHFYRSGDDWKHGKGGTMPLWALSELHANLGAFLARYAPSGAQDES